MKSQLRIVDIIDSNDFDLDFNDSNRKNSQRFIRFVFSNRYIIVFFKNRYNRLKISIIIEISIINQKLNNKYSNIEIFLRIIKTDIYKIFEKYV